MLVGVQDGVELLADLVLDPADLAEPPSHLTAHLGHPVGTEHEQGDEDDDDDLERSELGDHGASPTCGAARRGAGVPILPFGSVAPPAGAEAFGGEIGRAHV